MTTKAAVAATRKTLPPAGAGARTPGRAAATAQRGEGEVGPVERVQSAVSMEAARREQEAMTEALQGRVESTLPPAGVVGAPVELEEARVRSALTLATGR